MSIVLPVSISFYDWASSLQIDFSTEEVPLPPDDNHWKDWAQRLVERNIFQNNDIPHPAVFTDWRQWAMRVVQAVNG